MSYGFTPKQASAYDQWKTTPPDEPEEYECSKCGEDMEYLRAYCTWECPQCGNTIDNNREDYNDQL